MYGIILALKVFIIILFIAMILAIMLLTIPYNYVIKGEIKEKIKFKIQVNWLLGIFKIISLNLPDGFKIEAYFFNLCIYSSLRKNKSVYTENSTDISKKIKFEFEKLNFNLLKKIIFYLQDIFFILKPSTFNVEGIYGLKDPFFTGIVSSVVSIIKLNLAAIKIDIYPVFDKIILNVLIEVKGKIILFKLVIIAVKILRQKELRNLILTRA